MEQSNVKKIFRHGSRVKRWWNGLFLSPPGKVNAVNEVELSSWRSVCL